MHVARFLVSHDLLQQGSFLLTRLPIAAFLLAENLTCFVTDKVEEKPFTTQTLKPVVRQGCWGRFMWRGKSAMNRKTTPSNGPISEVPEKDASRCGEESDAQITTYFALCVGSSFVTGSLTV
ncbi:hypothetical protein CEXT_109861 [Caerostris extrusa]|uniref:Secreted protein n=1 Tax=Caerostris extrusa TaxID=172846 RepID=A0AAV4XDR5_CAEEX|nr:hypothetical protein CEXT_109861 [Caerostris extrusa]